MTHAEAPSETHPAADAVSAVPSGRGRHPHSPTGPARPNQTLLSSLLIGLVLAVLAWPSSKGDLVNRAGLYGWQTTLAMAAHNGMAFGTHIVFTYGPLGFLGVQQLNYSGTAILAFFFTLAMTTAIFTALVCLLRRVVPLLPAVVVAYVVGAVCVHTRLGPEYVLTLVLVVCVSLLDRPDSDPAPDWIWLVSGAVLSVFSLIKISLSLGIVVALLVTVVCQHRNRLRTLGALAVGAVVTFGLCWFATGNGVGNLLPFARHSEAVIGGYSAAMSIEDPTRAYVYWYAALVVVVIGLFATASARGLPRPSKIGIGLVTLVILWMLFKEGFVRHDSAHDLIFFTAASVALAAFPPAAAEGAGARAPGPGRRHRHRGRWLPRAGGPAFRGGPELHRRGDHPGLP